MDRRSFVGMLSGLLASIGIGKAAPSTVLHAGYQEADIRSTAGFNAAMKAMRYAEQDKTIAELERNGDIAAEQLAAMRAPFDFPFPITAVLRTIRMVSVKKIDTALWLATVRYDDGTYENGEARRMPSMFLNRFSVGMQVRRGDLLRAMKTG